MTVTTARIDRPGTGVADGSGNASCTIGPVPAWCIWQVASVTLSSTPAPAATATRPTGQLYRGVGANASNLLATSLMADNDTASGSVTMYPGEQLLVTWQGAVAGSQCVAVARGVQIQQNGPR